MQYRTAVFNLTNSPIFGIPNTRFGPGALGVIRGPANTPRQRRFALRLAH